MANDADLIAAIYDAVIDPSGWDEVVKRIVKATKSVSGGLHIGHTDAVHLSAMCNIDPFYADAHVQHYYKINPFVSACCTIAPGEVWTATHVSQTDTFKASVIFHEFVRPQGWADFVAIGLLRAPKVFGQLHLHRSPDAIWVEPREWQFLETLAPHLKRAAEVHQLLSRARAVTESLGLAVTAAGFAVFLLSGDCRVLFANAKAEDLVRRNIGLRYEHGQLAAATPALTQCLRALARDGAPAYHSDDQVWSMVPPCARARRGAA